MAKNKLFNNRTFNLLCFALAFLFTERSLRSIFLFGFSYRMMTVHTIACVAFSFAIVAMLIIKLIRNGFAKMKEELSPLAWYLAVFALYLVSTLINNGSIQRWYDDLFYSFSAIAILVIADDKKAVIKVSSWIYLVIAALNIFCELCYPVREYMSQWTPDYFIGFENAVGWPLLLGMLFSLLDYKNDGKLLKLLIYIALFFANQLMCFCATAMVGSMIIALYLILPFIRKAFEKWHFSVFLILVAVLSVLLVVFYGKICNIGAVRTLVEDVLKKDFSLSGRLYVWQGILPEALKKPLIGHGFAESTSYFFEESRWNNCYVHAHNEWLQTLYEGGFVTLLAGIAMVYFSTRKLKSKECKMILFTLLVMLQSDIIAYYPWYIVTFVCEVCAIETKQRENNI